MWRFLQRAFNALCHQRPALQCVTGWQRFVGAVSLFSHLLPEHVTAASDNREALSFLSLVEATWERGTFEMSGGWRGRTCLKQSWRRNYVYSLEVSRSIQGFLHKDCVRLCWPGSSEQPTCYWLWLSLWEVTVMFAGVLEVTLSTTLFLKAGEDDDIHPATLPLPYAYVKP